jgi:multiple sugar transport system ATP-binding protein
MPREALIFRWRKPNSAYELRVLTFNARPSTLRIVASVSIENVSKSFRGGGAVVYAIRDLNLSVVDREFLVVVGPSGCGKTTMLRLIAGLESPDSGAISLDGKNLNGTLAKDRDVAMVFQTPALFPHLTVAENIGFGLMLRKFAKAEIAQRVNEAAEMLGLTAMLNRKPETLSGGECQRVALGRAMVRKPKIFLFDEPLSNLDAPMRSQLRKEIKKLRQRVEATFLYVTHDQSEAISLADRIAVMREGRIEQIGTSQQIREQPANNFVREFMNEE